MFPSCCCNNSFFGCVSPRGNGWKSLFLGLMLFRFIPRVWNLCNWRAAATKTTHSYAAFEKLWLSWRSFYSVIVRNFVAFFKVCSFFSVTCDAIKISAFPRSCHRRLLKNIIKTFRLFITLPSGIFSKGDLPNGNWVDFGRLISWQFFYLRTCDLVPVIHC